MSSELTMHWSEHDASLERILRALSTSLSIFDEDLVRLRLERPENVEILRRFLADGTRHHIRIVLKNAEPFRCRSPRLFKLLATYPAQMTVVQCPEHLHALNDALFIVNDTHALVRFHKDNARARVIVDDAEACLPHVQRFNDIVSEGGEPISATTLGL
ncbi:MAG: hypothetical protein QM739_19045 [Propionivibrio sp.]